MKCWLKTSPPEDPGLLCYSGKLILQDTDWEGQEGTLQGGAVESGWPELHWSQNHVSVRTGAPAGSRYAPCGGSQLSPSVGLPGITHSP